ncbi:MAG: hypothetical protein ACLGIV_15410 [Actinomycetes bacterium]
MSKDRARRRAEREAAAAAERERRRRRGRRRRLLRPGTPARPRGRRPVTTGVLKARRRRQDGALLGVLVGAHAALWLATSSWSWRVGALVVTVLAWPVLVTVLFDRGRRA